MEEHQNSLKEIVKKRYLENIDDINADPYRICRDECLSMSNGTRVSLQTINVQLLPGNEKPSANQTYEIVDHIPNTIVTPATGTTELKATQNSHYILYILIAVALFALVMAIIFMIAYIIKRAKLDRLRHHLMPLYNFDPAEEELELQADLLEDDREQQASFQSSASNSKLKFHPSSALNS